MNSASTHLDGAGKPVYTVDVCIAHGGEFLMFKRSSTKKVFPGWLALPGGHIEEGENPLTAAIREVQEEVGITLAPQDIQLKFVAMHQHTDRNELFIVFGFRATLHTKPEHLVNNHEGNAVWMTRGELDGTDTIFPPVKYYFDHVLGNNPGIIYNYSIWNNAQLVRVVSEQTDSNS